MLCACALGKRSSSPPPTAMERYVFQFPCPSYASSSFLYTGLWHHLRCDILVSFFYWSCLYLNINLNVLNTMYDINNRQLFCAVLNMKWLTSCTHVVCESLHYVENRYFEAFSCALLCGNENVFWWFWLICLWTYSIYLPELKCTCIALGCGAFHKRAALCPQASVYSTEKQVSRLMQ